MTLADRLEKLDAAFIEVAMAFGESKAIAIRTLSEKDAEIASLQNIINQLAARVVAQSELLSKKAEKQ